MSFKVSKKYPQGLFCWADVASTDIAKTEDFLSGLMGWRVEHAPTDAGPDYTLFYLGDDAVAGGMPSYGDSDEEQSFWANYIAVDDLDVTVEKAKKLGAKVIMPSMKVMDAGHMAGIQDPTGAVVMFWQANNHIGAGIVNTVGAMGWNELLTTDVEKATNFYTDLFGWEYQVDEDSDNPYYMITNNGRANGGIMEIDPSWGEMPSHWIPYFTVKSITEAEEKTNKLGGSIITPMFEAPQGKMLRVADPTGAMMMLIELSVPADEWEE